MTATINQLRAVLTALEGKTSVQTGNDTELGLWRKIALALEQGAGASSTAADTKHGWMQRAAAAAEAKWGGSGAEENINPRGLLKRIVDAMEISGGAQTGSLSNRFTLTAPLVTFGVAYADWVWGTPWTGGYAVGSNFSAYGSSSRNGRTGPTTSPWNPSYYVNTRKASGAGLPQYLAAGSATSTTIAAAVAASTAAQRGYAGFVQIGGNYEATAGLLSTIRANTTTIATGASHLNNNPNVLWTVKFIDRASGFGTPDGARLHELQKWTDEQFPGRVTNWRLAMQYANASGVYAPTAQDTTDAAHDRSPITLMNNSNGDSSHMGTTGNQLFSDQDARFLDTVLNGTVPYIPMQMVRSRVGASARATNGTVIARIPMFDPANVRAACAVGVDDARLAASVGTVTINSVVYPALVLTKVGTTAMNEAYIDPTVWIARDGKRRFTKVRLYLCADPATISTPRVVRCKGGMMMREDYNGDANGGELANGTGVCGVIISQFYAANVDGIGALTTSSYAGDGVRQQFFAQNTGVGLQVYRENNNSWRVQVPRVADGTASANYLAAETAGVAASRHLIADGVRAFFFNLKSHAATPQYQAFMNSEVTAPSITKNGTWVDGDNFKLAPNSGVLPASRNADTAFGQTSAGGGWRRCHADIHLMWLGVGNIDFSIQANRDLFCDPTTKAPRDLGATGTVAGITPFFHPRGEAGDFAWGYDPGDYRRWHGFDTLSDMWTNP